MGRRERRWEEQGLPPQGGCAEGGGGGPSPRNMEGLQSCQHPSSSSRGWGLSFRTHWKKVLQLAAAYWAHLEGCFQEDCEEGVREGWPVGLHWAAW